MHPTVVRQFSNWAWSNCCNQGRFQVKNCGSTGAQTQGLSLTVRKLYHWATDYRATRSIITNNSPPVTLWNSELMISYCKHISVLQSNSVKSVICNCLKITWNCQRNSWQIYSLMFIHSGSVTGSSYNILSVSLLFVVMKTTLLDMINYYYQNITCWLHPLCTAYSLTIMQLQWRM